MINGYDISEFQKATPTAQALIIRAYNGWREDYEFANHLRNYKGEMLGVYTYITGNASEIRSFYHLCVNRLGSRRFVPCLDWESAYNRQWGNLSYLESCIKETIQLFGRSPMIYASSSVYPWDLAAKYDCPQWVACSILPKRANPTIWQWAWSPIDSDRFYIDAKSWDKLCVNVNKNPNIIDKIKAFIHADDPVDVFYAMRVKGSGNFLPMVKNAIDPQGERSDSYAGLPNHHHDMLAAKVSRGRLDYQVHTLYGTWLPWVHDGNPADLVNGCAGLNGLSIDGVRMYYHTAPGEGLRQAWYRVQTVRRRGWLGVVCDDGKSIKGYGDNYAGVYGEAIDRIQLVIDNHNPYR